MVNLDLDLSVGNHMALSFDLSYKQDKPWPETTQPHENSKVVLILRQVGTNLWAPMMTKNAHYSSPGVTWPINTLPSPQHSFGVHTVQSPPSLARPSASPCNIFS